MIGLKRGFAWLEREPIAVNESQLGLFGADNELSSFDGKQSSGDGSGCECSSCSRQSN